MEEARCKAEAETSRLEIERTSLLLELRATKDKVSSLHSRAGKDKEAMEDDYQKALEMIFNYGYRCCVFKHNICGDDLEVSDGMLDSSDLLPPDFFANLSVPLTDPLPSDRKSAGNSTVTSQPSSLD